MDTVAGDPRTPSPTNCKDVEQRLAQSEARFREIVEASYEGIWTIDTDLVTEYANPRMAEMLGYTVEDMIGRPLSDFMCSADLDIAQNCTQRQRFGARERLEFCFRRKDGEELWTMLSVSALFDEAGTYAGNLAMVTDITEQREAEKHLHSTEAFLAGVAANMAEGVLTLDESGHVTYLNRAAERMLGYRAKEVAGKTLRDGLHCSRGDGKACDMQHCPLLSMTGPDDATRIDDDVFERKDGTSLPVSLSASPLINDDGPAGSVVVFQDISERKAEQQRAQQELETLSWIGRLREAIDENRLAICAQPIVDVATTQVVQHELLVRLRDRDGKLVPPCKFLPVAEQFGLIGEIDRWMLTQGIRLATRGQAVAVNLSAHSLNDPGLAGVVERELRDAGADPGLVTFEVTETALMEHPETATRLAQQISQLGCGIALDDFGTGYGGFTYLKRLPVTLLKIDMEFVRDLPRNEASQHVVKAVVSLAQGFGQKTVAEGVEDEQTLELLRDLGVDYAQGYHLGRPEELTLAHASPTTHPAGRYRA